MLRSDSVVDPARAAVSFTIAVWTVLMRWLSVELSSASTGTHRKYAGAMIQCTLSAYTVTNTIPTSVVKSTLTEELMSRSTSVRTFWSLPSVSPLRWSSKTW